MYIGSVHAKFQACCWLDSTIAAKTLPIFYDDVLQVNCI